MSITFKLDDLITPLTSEQVKKSIYDMLGVLGVSTTSWKPGGVVRSIVASCSVTIAALSQLTARLARMSFLETSEGDWLTLVAHHVYGVDRFAATFASGTVTLTNSAGGVFVYAVGELVISSSATGKEYRNTVPITIPALSSVSCDVAAVEAGSASTAFAGEIDTLVTTAAGVSVTNALDFVGQDEETDEALRLRCRDKLGSLSPNGPADAYAHFARNSTRAADGTSIGVSRVRTTNDAAGNVYVYVATASGAVPGTIGNTSTDLGKVDDDIQRNAVPLGITAHVASATPVAVPITYELWAYNTVGMSAAQLASAINAALDQFFAKQPIGGNVIDFSGGHVFRSEIISVISNVRPEIFRVDLTSPAVDVSLASNEVPTLGALVVTGIHQQPPTGL